MKQQTMLVGYEADFTSASADAVLFLWQNWHLYFKLHNALIDCAPTSKYSWEAQSFFGAGEWYLTQQDCSPHMGLLHFHNYITFAALLSKVQTIFQYHRLADGRLWYCGGGYGALHPYLSPLALFPQWIATGLLRWIGRRGGIIAADIAANPALVQNRCGLEASTLFQQYTDEFRDVSENRNADARAYFTERKLIPISIYENQYKSIITPYIDDINGKVENIKGIMSNEFDVTLLDVAKSSVLLGLPGAASVALRDFLRQHGLDSVPASSEVAGDVFRFVRGAGGRMKRYMNADDALAGELTMLDRGLDVVALAVSRQQGKRT
jgi:hypothetical protein